MNRAYAPSFARLFALFLSLPLFLQCQCSLTVHTLLRLGARVIEHTLIHIYNNDGHHSTVIMFFFFFLSIFFFFFMSNLIEQSDRHIHLKKKRHRKNFITKICRQRTKNIHKMSKICEEIIT